MDYRQEPLMRYLDDAAAAQPTPGGGSVAAMAAALASTMASMAAGFTAGKEKFKAVEPDIQAALTQLAGLRQQFPGVGPDAGDPEVAEHRAILHHEYVARLHIAMGDPEPAFGFPGAHKRYE